MVDISAIAAAVSAFKGASDIAQAMIGLRDAAAFQSKLIEFQAKILEAQSAAFAANDERATLIEEIGRLKQTVADLEAWDAKSQRYELRQISQNHGFAYALKDAVQPPEPQHWACTRCYEERHTSIL